MKSYTYKNPIHNGYKRFHLTKRQHNALFPKRPRRWIERYEYFYNEHNILMHKFINWKGIILTTLLLPFTILRHGTGNTKDILRELRELYNQKGTGAYSSELVSNSTKYQTIMDMIQSYPLIKSKKHN